MVFDILGFNRNQSHCVLTLQLSFPFLSCFVLRRGFRADIPMGKPKSFIFLARHSSPWCTSLFFISHTHTRNNQLCSFSTCNTLRNDSTPSCSPRICSTHGRLRVERVQHLGIFSSEFLDGAADLGLRQLRFLRLFHKNRCCPQIPCSQRNKPTKYVCLSYCLQPCVCDVVIQLLQSLSWSFCA